MRAELLLLGPALWAVRIYWRGKKTEIGRKKKQRIHKMLSLVRCSQGWL